MSYRIDPSIFVIEILFCSVHICHLNRDGFYELIREWEASRMNPNYNMAEMFGQRVHALVNVRTDLANLVHFARLFQSQLIAVSRQDV